MSDLISIIDNFSGKNILVIGDLILDQYIRGSVSRISPEAPVPVVLQEGEAVFTPGGSASVANNLSQLGAKVSLMGKVGDDQEGRLLVKLLEERKIAVKGIVIDKNIPTSLKTRIIALRQQVVRVDREKKDETPCEDITSRMIQYVHDHIDSLDAVIISDYGKGVITPRLVNEVCQLAHKNNKIITVDPKEDHFEYYRKVTTITPNKKETENAIRNIKIRNSSNRQLEVNSDNLKTMDEIKKAGQELQKYLELESLLVTLGELGMCLFENGKEPFHIKTQAREVFDVTGAGDSVISVFTLALTTGATKQQAAELSNIAAGIVVGKMGAVAVTKEELQDTITGL
ncbi:MAG: D-glycero-beta-D-manno-heptose-7-phosphate kinase [Candidatus Omnitrophica bacterium]|nr:D-glycero-beta-D-manno-heptose-7-phosphate kinase [Candidatus Omnitrophota bacterium]MCB9746863.1 D-glycero-beta-D-manno-heptose-7-phosphate kinase [Candidatus Omnitrophota bacterium]